MKPGPPFPPLPDDAATDPLLAALRQRLGDYGQAPPPGAWAAIRRQVAPPALPPWWRRRHLLALMGLLLCFLRPSTLGEWATLRRAGLAAAGQPPGVAPSLSPLAGANAPSARTAHPAGRAATERATPLGAATASRSSSLPKTAAEPAALLPRATTEKNALATTTRHAGAVVADRPTAGRATVLRQSATARTASSNPQVALSAQEAASSARRKKLGFGVALAASRKAHRRQLGHWPAAGHRRTIEPVLAGLAPESIAANRPSGWLAHRGRAHAAAQAASRNPYAQRTFETTARSAARRGPLAWQPASRSGRAPGRLEIADLATAAPAETVALAALAPSASGAYPLGPVDSLVLRQPGLVLPSAAALATLVVRPDSAPAAHPARRWSLLVVAGPTLSYRTLGPAPVLAAGHPDFARLERPALGLGAQVQVRRVLSGRWALAVGVGYHEYATRLALSLKDTASVHQRDTYRLLTVPVQLGYALGAPKNRLSKALLLGVEPGWYLGCRSTEGSGCGCEQQTYTSAASSPYRSLSVAFSLGLDLRYRVGSAGSRWQWLVQPTGRYVATPFVRSEAVGFTPRHPFSLGLLTGFSWDVR